VDWVYLSPHLDDAALSCGGWIWEAAESGEQVAIWTVCAGDPPAGRLSAYAESLHLRWETGREAVALRRAEDLCACRQLHAAARHFAIPDCIYRRSPIDGSALYNSDEEIFGKLDPLEAERVESLRGELAGYLPAGVNVVCPLGLGGHVDHQLVRAAADGLGLRLWYYADYPYVLQEGRALERLSAGLHEVKHVVTERGLQAWVAAVACYRSQLSTFWPDETAMEAELRAFCQASGGVRLWRLKDQ
jgi:LmbE family N-acetylglucosaminyl deacetylase